MPVSLDRSNKDNWPNWVKSLDNVKVRDKSAYNVWTDVDSVQHQGIARCNNCASKGRECVARPSGSARMNKCAYCCKIGKVCSFQPIKAFHKRELPNKFYCEKPQTCPEIGCQSTKIFKPRNFTVHMKAEHGDPKDIKCTEHKVCQAKEPKKLYNAFTLSRHIIEYNAGVKQKEKKQPCDHSDCRGLTKQRTPRMLIYHKKMNHGEAKTLPCSYHDLCKRRYRPKLYNAYGLVRHQKIVEQRLKEILNATRCTHSDCSQDETLYPKTEMKHHWKAEHGEKKGLWCTKHLDCKYQSKQYNSYTYGLHMKHREYASRRKSSDSARKCTHPKCVRSRRKLTQRQMQNHWKTSHGGPATSCEVHEGCRDSSLRYNKHTLPIHIASVRREEQSKKQGPWLKCSSPICVDNTKEYHPRALVEHQRRHDKQKIYECKEKDCEDGDKLFDKKTFQEHQFQHAMRNRGCASCDHDDCRGSPLLFEEAMLVDHKLEYHQTKQCERCTHVDCQGSENVYNLWTMAEHMLRHRAPESLSLDSEDEFEDEQEDDESAEVAFNFETDCDFDDQDHDKEVGDQDFDDIFDDLDYEDQNKPDSNDQSENADSEEALGQFKKHETPNAHLTEEANPDIVIDETPRPLQIIRVEASENEPVSWTVRKTYCPVVNCRLNKPDAIAINDLPLHVEDIHGLSRRDPRLRLYASIICTFPGCKKTISPLSLTGHVNGAHNEFDAVRCSHADCKHNQCLYTPRQKKIHMLTHAPKTLKCNEPGCEDSDLLYNEKSLRGHIYRHPIKLFCPFRDCGTPLRSCSNMHSHVFIQHNIQTTLANLKAAACTAFNVCLPGQLKMEAHSSPRDDLTSASERQLEHFLQDHVRKSKVGSAQMDDDQDGALDGNRSLEFEEKEAGEVLMSIEECDGDSEDGDSDEDVSDDSEELAHGSDPATLVETHEIGAMLNCASSSKFSANVRSCIKEWNLKKIDRWGLTDSFRLHFSSDQAYGICCGSGSLPYCDFDCLSGETLSLETTLILSIRCWRCITLARQLSTLRRKRILLEKNSEITECAGDGCSNAPWVGTKYCHVHLVDTLLAARKSPQSFVKWLHRIRDSRKTRDKEKFLKSYPLTGFQIEEPADMFDFFKCGELDTTTPSMENFLGLILDGADNVRMVDTEFAGSILLQVAFRNARGDLLYKRTIDHGVTVKDLYEKAVAQRGPFNFVLEPIRRFHGPPSLKLTGESENTRTLTEMFTEIENEGIIQPKHMIAEWSINRCDYHFVYAAAENAGFTHLMPPVENSVLCVQPLRKTMPDPKSDLVLKAHVADVDTKMLAILLPVFGLKISGREDEFLPYWEKYGGAPGGWTKIFFKQWKKKPIEIQSNNHALVLSTVSSKKRKSQPAENVVASKKIRTQLAITKSLLKRVNTKSRNRNIPTRLVASGSISTSSRIKPLAVPRKQVSKVVQVPSADAEGADFSEARQSSRIKAPVYYGGASHEDDSGDFVESEDEADDESE